MKLHPMRASLLALPLTLTIIGLSGCSSDDAVPAPHTYQMGERVPMGHLIYAVFDRAWLPQIGRGVDARVPQNRFYSIRISVVNSGGASALLPAMSLMDDAGTLYPEIENGDGVQDFLGALHQLAPAESVQGYVVFDVPPKHYKLKLADEEAKRFDLVDIPLSFDTEVPDITTPLEGVQDAPKTSDSTVKPKK